MGLLKKFQEKLVLQLLVLAFFLKLSPVLIIICAGLLGYVARTLAGRREGER